MSPPRIAPLGAKELAVRYNVDPATIAKWKQRGKMPAADLQVGGRDAWWPDNPALPALAAPGESGSRKVRRSGHDH